VWRERCIPDYPPEGALHCHLSWHRALFEMGRGRLDAALAIYESSIAPGRSLGSPFSPGGGADALLWRCELAGATARPEAWRALAAHVATTFPSPSIAFLDVHC